LPKDASTSLGGWASFQATATTDDSPLSRQWQHNGTNLNVADSVWLRLTNVTELDAGEYRAILSDAAGNTATSRVATLTIDPTFVRMTPLVASSDLYLLTWVDLEGDGWLDLVAVGGYWTPGGKPLHVYQNNRDGTLTRVTTNSLAQISLRGVNLCWGDYDSDGDLDAFAGVWEAESPLYLRNEGAGKFTRTKLDQYWSANGIDVRGSSTATADYDGDGQLDVMMGFWGNAAGKWGTNRVLHGVGGGRFEVDLDSPLALTRVWPETFAWVDYDDDGDVDLFSSTSGDANQNDYLFQNLGQGRFERVTDNALVKIPDLSLGQAWGDYDNDGDLDVLLGNQSQTQLLYENLGGGDFQLDPAGPEGKPSDGYGIAAWADYDNDGWLDLFLAQGANLSRMWHNRGDGTLEEVLTGSPVQEARGIGMAWGDYDNDGFVDLVVLDPWKSVNWLYRNNLKNAGNKNHWLKVKLQGVASNRDGIGATVRVKAMIGGKTFWQRRQIVSQSHQLDLLAHFGLGDAATVETLRIEWPSGNAQELTDVTPDQLLTVKEAVRITPFQPTASVGGSVTLTRAGAGTDALYQWRFNGVDLAGKTGRTLNLTNLLAADAGHYSVVVSNTAGIVTNFVYLHVDTQFTKITTGPPVTDRGSSWGASWGDYDGDGFADLFVARNRNGLSALYHNNRDGTFATVSNPPFPQTPAGWMSGAWADFDNDGRQDLVATLVNVTFSGNSCFVYFNEGDGTFHPIGFDVALFNWGVAVGDYNRDGFVDLLFNPCVASPREVQSVLYRNNGDRTFTRVSNQEAGSIVRFGTHGAPAWADYDDDGWLDLYSPNWRGLDRLYRNDATGRFVSVTNTVTASTQQSVANAAAWGDYDNDGRIDLCAVAWGGETIVYRNQGLDSFERADIGQTIRANCDSASWADYDNDGFLDLLVGGVGNLFYRNNGDGTLTKITFGSIPTDGSPGAAWDSFSTLWFDYDNDGFLDLYVSNGGEDPTSVSTTNGLYRNNGNANAWLKVKPVGTASNRDGVGAKVRAKAKYAGKVRWQRRDISAGDGYNGNHLYAHFGLGNATNVMTLRIEWPSGAVQELANIAPNQILTVWEPPVLKAVVQADGACALNIRAEPNRAWQIQASNDLLTWQKLVEFKSATMDFQYGDTAAAGMDCRFYRVSPE
ncbi:MAG: FG-GAP-like repeat-containing protein, partial [Limisphaerales bacterium]